MPSNGAQIGALSSAPGWSLRSICWRNVFRYQDWVSLIFTVGVVIGLVVADQVQPTTTRPFLEYDATISYPHRGSSTIPYWVAIVVPFFLMLISFAIGELIVGRKWHRALSSAVSSTLFFTIDGLSAFVFTGFATQISKAAVGRLRPDFLARCQPGGQGTNISISYGQGSSANPVCTPSVSSGELEDGMWSFPSGHTSTVFVFAVYGAAYCIWAFYFRVQQLAPAGAATPAAPSTPHVTMSSHGAWGEGGGQGVRQGSKSTHLNGSARWLRDLWGLLGFVWILVQMAFAWGVSLSRITDFKHHPSDVVGGAVLGGVLGLLYLMRAIPRHRRLDGVEEACGVHSADPWLLREGGVQLSASETA